MSENKEPKYVFGIEDTHCESELFNTVDEVIEYAQHSWDVKDDEKMFHTIIADLKGFKHDNTSCLASHFDNCITWLKSLKDRYTWKRVEKQGG